MFGELSYDILPNLTFTGGIRGFKAHNTLTGFSGFSIDTTGKILRFASVCANQQAIPCQNVNKVYKQSGETHKLNLTWKPNRDRMIYFTYSTGFRPGGNNRKPQYGPFKADTITNYELGFKTSWLDRHLRINGAFYYEDLGPPGDFAARSQATSG